MVLIRSPYSVYTTCGRAKSASVQVLIKSISRWNRNHCFIMNPASRHLHTLDLNVDELFSSGNLILVHEKGEKQEPPIDGSFMLQLLINDFCAKTGQPAHSHVPATVPDKKILLVLTHQTEKHWSQCCSKLGQNLESLKKSGSLTVIDTLKLEYDALNPNHNSAKTEEPFSGLIDQCKSAIDSLCIPSCQTVETKPRLLIIIENLTSLFLSQGDSSAHTKNTMNVLEFLRILRTYRLQELDTCVATLVKSNIHDQSWVNSNSCQAHGNYMANLVTECFDATLFEVCPLSTGYSDEIHGLLNIKPRNKSYHFKMEDRTVTFVAT